MLRTFVAPCRRRSRGAAAVEFALVAPLLLLLLFGILSYGYMLSFRQAMSQAAGEAARSAAVAPTTLAVADRQVRAMDAVNEGLGSYGVECVAGQLRHGGRTAGTCTVSTPQTCSASTPLSKCVEVSLDYQYRDNSLIPNVPGLGIVLPAVLGYSTEAEVTS